MMASIESDTVCTRAHFEMIEKMVLRHGEIGMHTREELA